MEVIRILTVLFLMCALSRGQSLTVETNVGDIVGFEDSWGGKVIHKFRGIPYAEAPIGDLRFSQPVPKAPFKEPFHATKFGSPCPQSEEWLTGFIFSREEPKNLEMSEDCLNLNIYVPSGGEEKKAVMVWIHGGAYTVGVGMMYDGTKISALGDVIVVTINYRLALLGLFHSDDEDIHGNQLLLDQQLALKWVHNNIAAFGGDTGRVTIFGESAGSGSVSWQMLAPSNQGLFQRVIAESGTALAPWSFADPETSAQYQNVFIEKVGCADTDSRKVLACLRKVPFTEFKANPVGYPHGESIKATFPTGPRMDGSHIKFSPKSRKHGERMEDQAFFRSLDYMIGANKYEGSPFVVAIIEPKYNKETGKSLFDGIPFEVFHDMVQLWGVSDGPVTKDVAEALWWLYGTSQNLIKNGMMTIKEALEYTGDAFFYDGITKFVKRHAAGGSETSGNTYQYSFLPPTHALKGTMEALMEPVPGVDGAIHGTELAYLFGRDADLEAHDYMNEGENQLSDILITYWTNFAKTGDPNEPVKVPKEWPQYQPNEEKFIEFDIVNKKPNFNIGTAFRNRFSTFWRDVIPKLQGNRQGNPQEEVHEKEREAKTEL